MADKAGDYDSSEIRVLEGLEPVRLRPVCTSVLLVTMVYII